MQLLIRRRSQPLLVDLTRSVEECVVTTFPAMCGTTVESIPTARRDRPMDGIIGMISFVGDLRWWFLLGLPRTTAAALGCRFAGFEVAADSDEMCDLVGELANILAADLSAKLELRGTSVEMSTPTIAQGADVQFLLPRKLPGRRVDFISSDGDFWAKVIVDTSAAATART